ncbi:hypothetical protein [Pseudozobellia thermophila]|nr:hypothetical protein [Pseudozobellia thermophila]
MREGEKINAVPLLSFDIYFEHYHKLLTALENQKDAREVGGTRKGLQ